MLHTQTFRRLTCLLLLLLLAATGCSDKASNESTPGTATSAPTQATTSPSSTSTPTPTPKEDNPMTQYQELTTQLPPSGYDAEREGITYPVFQKFTYYSETAKRDTPVNVLLPEGYTTERTYPVLYILHGYFDNEEWMARKVVGLSQIYQNLLTEGKAKEMIIVLPYIFCSETKQYVDAMTPENHLAYDNFINDMTTSLMPFIESNFSVATGPENTAITGFSMGGRESLFIAVSHPDWFGYVGAVCPAPGLTPMPGHVGQLAESDLHFQGHKPSMLLISSSKSDGVVGTSPDTYRKAFWNNGEQVLAHVLATTGHDHSSVKPHLYIFLQTLFQ